MKLFLLLVIWLNTCDSLTLPSTFTKCDKRKPEFNECLSKAMQNAISQLVKPKEKYNLPSFEPFRFTSLSPKSGQQMASSSIKFKNFQIYGHTKINSSKVNMNFQDNTMIVELSHPEIRYEFDYQAKGKMFILPFDSAGHATVTSKNTTYTIQFTLEEFLINNKKYLRVSGTKMMVKPESMIIYYENLFKDKALNDAFNRELNASWRPILINFGTVYMDSYAKVYGDVFNNFLEVVPLVDLFDGIQ